MALKIKKFDNRKIQALIDSMLKREGEDWLLRDFSDSKTMGMDSPFIYNMLDRRMYPDIVEKSGRNIGLSDLLYGDKALGTLDAIMKSQKGAGMYDPVRLLNSVYWHQKELSPRRHMLGLISPEEYSNLIPHRYVGMPEIPTVTEGLANIPTLMLTNKGQVYDAPGQEFSQYLADQGMKEHLVNIMRVNKHHISDKGEKFNITPKTDISSYSRRPMKLWDHLKSHGYDITKGERAAAFKPTFEVDESAMPDAARLGALGDLIKILPSAGIAAGGAGAGIAWPE